MIQMLDDIYTYVMAQASQRSRRIKCEKWSASLQKRYSKMLSMCLFITLDLEEDINRKRETVIHPLSIIPRQQFGGNWNSGKGILLFFAQGLDLG